MRADHPTPKDWIERGYLAMVQWLPAAFRAEFAGELFEFFRARRQAARDRGRRAHAMFLLRAAVDLVKAVWRERRPKITTNGSRRPPFTAAARDDLRAAIRRLRRAPQLTLTIVGLLALTIGSATVIFSVANAVLFRPLPFPGPDRILLLWETRANVHENNVGAHEFPVWSRHNRAFQAMAAIVYQEGLHLTGPGEPESVLGVRVSEPFFRVMGVAPAIGRAFTAEEDIEGAPRVAIVSHRVWRERLGGDVSALGRDIILDGRAHRIVGVMPPDFAFPPARLKVTPDVWMPVAENLERQRGRHHLYVVGRLNDGTTAAAAEADLASIAATLARDLPEFSSGHGVRVEGLQAHLVGDVKPSILLLAGAVGCLVLIGCSNVASLLLASGLVRRRQTALELAIGATRGRVTRQVLVESVVMSVAGGALGLMIAIWLTRLVPGLLPPGVLTVDEVTIDLTVFCFAAGVSIVTGLLFGLAPAAQLGRVGPADTLKQGGRSLVGGAHTRLRRVLVTAQIALAVLLALSATLMARGLVALQRVQPGFATGDTLTVELGLRGPRYARADQQREFFEGVRAHAAALPGVSAVGTTDNVPLSGGTSGMAIGIEGRPDHEPEASAQYRVISPGYFGAMGVRIVAGRDFAASDARLAVPLIRWWPQQPLPEHFDRAQAMPVAIVNESMARAYWPGGALGRRFTVIASPLITVVGVVADMRTVSLRANAGPEFYLTSVQEPVSSMNLLIRAKIPPLELAPAVRDVIRKTDPALPIGVMRTMDDVVGMSYSRPAFLSTLLAVFATIALVLMTAGVYGLLAFTAAQRMPEIGVRIALGAGRGQIHRLILHDALVLTCAGLVMGVVASVALGQFIEAELYGITPTDRPTFVAVTALVAAAAILACWRPARAAARVDPLVVLRQD